MTSLSNDPFSDKITKMGFRWVITMGRLINEVTQLPIRGVPAFEMRGI